MIVYGILSVYAFLVLIEKPSFELVYCLNVFFVSFFGANLFPVSCSVPT